MGFVKSDLTTITGDLMVIYPDIAIVVDVTMKHCDVQ